jgi:hypothetical protein
MVLIPTISFSGTNTWQGKSTDWSAIENWSTGVAPADKDGNDVVIPKGVSKYPELTKDVVINGSLILQGDNFIIKEVATLTVKGDLVFNGPNKWTTAMTLNSNVILYGNIVTNDSAVCNGSGNGWVILSGNNDQYIHVSSSDGILPPIKISKPSGKVKLSSDIACAGLWITKNNTLEVPTTTTIQFGGYYRSSSVRGFINEGNISKEIGLIFSAGCYSAKLEPGNMKISNLIIDTGNYGYSVNLTSDIVITGDLDMKTGRFNMGEQTITIGGSCYLPPLSDTSTAKTVYLNMGQKAKFVFNTGSNAVLVPGSPYTKHSYNTTFQNIVIDKPGSALTLKQNPLVINGLLQLKNGKLAIGEGGEIWLGVVREGRYGLHGERIVDIGLKIKSDITPEIMPEIIPPATGPFTPSVVSIVNNDIGPKIPASIKLVNIARFADIKTFPYTTMARTLVDPDEKLRTMQYPETGSLPVKAIRYEFRYDKPQVIAGIRWAVPSGQWVILADTKGKGEYDKVLRMDLEGKLTNYGGIWHSRTWVNNYFWPAVKVYAIQFVTFPKPIPLYDFQILSPAENVEFKVSYELEKGFLELEQGELVEVPVPPVEKQFLKGFHIEPWMFNIDSWINMDKQKRPLLSEYKPFVEFIQRIKKYHANTVNMWPPRAFSKVRGRGTYEMDVLWPSKYDKWSSTENVLKEISSAFHKNRIKFFVMDRVTYAKKLEEFPETKTRDLLASYISRSEREYLTGIVREQVKSGVDGVGIGYDEQYFPVRIIGSTSPADEFTKKCFVEKYKVPVPEKEEDTEEYHKWVVFAYEEIADYLASAAKEAKSINAKVYTKAPINTSMDAGGNERIKWGIANDIILHKADIDFPRGNCYEGNDDLGHYKVVNVIRVIAANKKRTCDTLHNNPWAWDGSEKYPGYYLETTPVYMYGPPISSFIHGGRLPMYWRYDHIGDGGYDKYVEQAYSILDTLASWDAKEAKIPKCIMVLRSRTSEDWWQIRQRYNKDGNPADQTRGFLYEKWLLEFLLSNGYQFEMYYLDQSKDFEKELTKYKLVILPFPYSIKKETFNIIAKNITKATKVLIFDRQGDTDEWGNFYDKPIFTDLITNGKVTFIDDDVPSVGHYPKFIAKMIKKVDSLLGDKKILYLNTYGNDIEVGCMEKSDKERYVFLINWTDRQVKIDAGIKMPPLSSYQVFQRDLNKVNKLKINNKESFSAKDLEKFRIGLEPWEIKVLYIHPETKL